MTSTPKIEKVAELDFLNELYEMASDPNQLAVNREYHNKINELIDRYNSLLDHIHHEENKSK